MSFSTGSNRDDNTMDRLVKKRKADRDEEIKQEFEHYPTKRLRSAESESSEEDEIETSISSTRMSDFKQSSSAEHNKHKPDRLGNSGIYLTKRSFATSSSSEADSHESGIASSNVGIGWSLMAKSGYKPQTGLGRLGQGLQQPVEVAVQPGRLGFGHEATKALTHNEGFDYDEKSEIKSVEETPLFLTAIPESVDNLRDQIDTDEWIIINKPKFCIEDEDRYCDKELIVELIKCKSIFDSIPSYMLNRARMRANPYETVKAGFFQNRAAMKTANLDRIFDWALSGERNADVRHARNPVEIGESKHNADRDAPLFYFADVCAGPGGFSEYLLWRKAFYNAKGFGFTLRGNDDFKLDKFLAAEPEYFETYYGCKDNGDVTDPDNLRSLEDYIKERTHGEGVQLVMCDGGFSVTGRENIQEILSKRLYLCQFIVGLALNRASKGECPGGNFLCKLFDIFTPFSMGLIYLMYCAFEQISLHKPVSSRPANSERYIFCENLTEFGATVIKDYLVKINNRLDEIKKRSQQESEDVYEIVPDEIIRNDSVFYEYVLQHNEDTIRRQIFYLKKYRAFAKNNGAIDIDQTRIREECLSYWDLPNLTRTKTHTKQPESKMLEALTDCRLEQGTSGGRPFVLDVLKPREPRHKSVLEFRAALLPESKEPFVLVAAGGNHISVLNDGKMERLDIMALPSRTVLFVQITDKYSIGETITKCGSVIYVVDAAVLNGDDISSLPLSKRLVAIEKFCEASNRANIKDGNLDCELVCANYQELDDLVNTELEVKKFKLADMAIFNITGQSSIMSTCRAVRIVNIMAPTNTIYWSVSNKRTYISDEIQKCTYPHEAPFTAYSSFYDVVRRVYDHNNAPRAWQWSWETQHSKNFSVKNVLNDDAHDAGITLKALRTELNHLEDYFQNELQRRPSSLVLTNNAC